MVDSAVLEALPDILDISHLLVETLEFQKTQSSEASFSFLAQNYRLAHTEEVSGSKDPLFGIQRSLLCLVETLEFQNTQMSEAKCPAQN